MRTYVSRPAICLALVVGFSAGYQLGSPATNTAEAQACERPGYVRGGTCRGRERDATGCCPAPTRPTRRPHRPPTTRRACAPGQVQNEDTAGHCCWPGQVWSRSRSVCLGEPSCPADMVSRDDMCHCPGGRSVSADTVGHCCWSGQAWSRSRSECVGEPTSCPPGLNTAATGCEVPTGMVYVPGGTFSMGSGSGDDDERPVHEVTLSAYLIDRTEVTVDAYARCVRAGQCTSAATTVEWAGIEEGQRRAYGAACNANFTDRGGHPVNCVTWTQADAYCRWSNQRLPTEAEWEYAARGTDGRTYPWGNDPPAPNRLNAVDPLAQAWIDGFDRSYRRLMFEQSDGWATTAPVGSYPAGASPFGALDMAGNVWEWTADWYGAYSSAAQRDPTGPSGGRYRVNRGGSWSSNSPAWVRGANRNRYSPSYRVSLQGFRCARGT